MRQESLRELLSRVHERLSHARSIDPESRKLLETLMKDIERALGGHRHPESPVHRLEELAVRFEAEHPALAGVMRQLGDALGKAGI